MLKLAIFSIVAALALHVTPAVGRHRYHRQVLQFPESDAQFDYNKQPLSKDEYEALAKVVKAELQKDDLNMDDLARIVSYYYWQNPIDIPKDFKHEKFNIGDLYYIVLKSVVDNPRMLHVISSDVTTIIDSKLAQFNKIAEEDGNTEINEEKQKKLTQEEYEVLAEEVKAALRKNPADYIKIVEDYLRKNPDEFAELKDTFKAFGPTSLTIDDYMKFLNVRLQHNIISLPDAVEGFIKSIDDKLAKYEKAKQHEGNAEDEIKNSVLGGIFRRR